eukprot:1158396-Pelagomonas_calceolata.AAC.9
MLQSRRRTISITQAGIPTPHSRPSSTPNVLPVSSRFPQCASAHPSILAHALFRSYCTAQSSAAPALSPPLGTLWPASGAPASDTSACGACASKADVPTALSGAVAAAPAPSAAESSKALRTLQALRIKSRKSLRTAAGGCAMR